MASRNVPQRPSRCVPLVKVGEGERGMGGRCVGCTCHVVGGGNTAITRLYPVSTVKHWQCSSRNTSDSSPTGVGTRDVIILTVPRAVASH